MMKLNLNFQFTALDGKEVEGEMGHAGKALGMALANANEGNSIKLTDWALKLWNGGVIEVDNSDKGVIKAFVESTKGMSNLAKKQILDAIEKVKEREK